MAVTQQDILAAAEQVDRDREQAALQTTAVPLVRITPQVGLLSWAALLIVLLAAPLLLDDLGVFRIGRVLVVAISAMALHLLVHWAGQVSLAQGAFVGIPAFITARLAADVGLPFAVTLPVGILAGALVGAIVALPALRVKGVKIAIVTLLFGVAVDRFLFTKAWFAGADVIPVPAIQLGPYPLITSAALYPVLLAVFAVTIAVVRLTEESKFRRALSLVKVEEELGEARGINSGFYKILAFVLAGALAGVAGVMQAYWITQVGQSSFQFSYSLLILTIAIVAGRGSVGATIVAAFALAFVAVPNWLPPLLLLAVVIAYPGGVNEAFRGLNVAGERAWRSTRTWLEARHG